MFCRIDAQNWARWKFYPGAMTILIPRLLCGIFFAGLAIVLASMLLIGHKKNEPIPPGSRKTLLKFVYKVCVHLQSVFSFWTVLSYSYTKDTSYEKYLGKDTDSEHE